MFPFIDFIHSVELEVNISRYLSGMELNLSTKGRGLLSRDLFVLQGLIY